MANGMNFAGLLAANTPQAPKAARRTPSTKPTDNLIFIWWPSFSKFI
jgi:hypothetical protein